MFNEGGIKKKTGTSPNQILANVELQSSVGCVVPESMGTNDKVLAGTPLSIDLTNLQTPAEAAGDGKPMNAVLLHDVNVANGNANGTALVFGFINLNRVDSTVATKLSAAAAADGASPMVVVMKA